MYIRLLKNALEHAFQKKQSFFLFGPRQVGKTSLIQELLPENALSIPLHDPSLRIHYEKDPGSLIRQIEARSPEGPVFIDEAQKVPELLDAVQYLIDGKKASFAITGSSARKLKMKGVNLLPGRIKSLRMDPLTWAECGWINHPTLEALSMKNLNQLKLVDFEESLVFGSLPGMIQLEKTDRIDFLRTYATTYLEEEIRDESLVRQLGPFSRFLELAAQESGTSPNLTKLSLESGVSVPSIKSYYQILEDTLITHRLDPFLKNARKRILASPRYYFFDLGVRNALARLPLNKDLLQAQKGLLFEHAVVLELKRRIHALNRQDQLYYWRTYHGAEVDVILDLGDELIPIEIKATRSPRLADLKGLLNFLEDYKSHAKKGYVITMGDRPEKLNAQITAIPWSYL